MNPKERIRAVLDGRETDRIPVDLWYTPEIGAALMTHYGVKDAASLHKVMGLDKITWCFLDYQQEPDEAAVGSQVGAEAAGAMTMWGVPLKEVQSGAATYHEFGEPPLKGYDVPEALEEYPYWPDPDKFDYDAAVAHAQRASQDFATIGPWVSFFEIYCQMRGLEQALMDIALEPELTNAILDRIENCQTQMLKRFFERAADHLDLCFVSDDMGSQESLLMSLGMWERYFKERMTRWCDLIHSYGIKVFYHTDGAAETLVPNLIDCGIDVLNPIQHVCPGMDMARLKDKYGGQVVFHGGVDNQSVLPFGTVEDVKRETLDCLKTLGRNGKGYIVCSCHNVQPGTPVENVIAMVETVREYTS